MEKLLDNLKPELQSVEAFLQKILDLTKDEPYLRSVHDTADNLDEECGLVRTLFDEYYKVGEGNDGSEALLATAQEAFDAFYPKVVALCTAYDEAEYCVNHFLKVGVTYKLQPKKGYSFRHNPAETTMKLSVVGEIQNTLILSGEKGLMMLSKQDGQLMSLVNDEPIEFTLWQGTFLFRYKDVVKNEFNVNAEFKVALISILEETNLCYKIEIDSESSWIEKVRFHNRYKLIEVAPLKYNQNYLKSLIIINKSTKNG